MKENVNKLVSAIISKDKEAQSNAFESIMRDKLNAALNSRKIVIADSVFNGKKE